MFACINLSPKRSAGLEADRRCALLSVAARLGLFCDEEVFHCRSNFDDMRLGGKMSCVKELNPGVRQVLAKRLCSRGDEEGIVLAPDRKQGRPRFAEIFLELRIELHVRCIIEKQIEL